MPASAGWCIEKETEADGQEAIAKEHEARAEELWDESEGEWQKFDDALDELEEIEDLLAQIEDLEGRQGALDRTRRGYQYSIRSGRSPCCGRRRSRRQTVVVRADRGGARFRPRGHRRR
jgi:hypothetical protein